MGDYACQAQSILPISLLDDMLKKNEQKKHQNITRTVLVGKSVNGPIKIAAFQSKITAVEKTLSRANARDSTVLGLLSLIYEQCFLLVIESSCEKSIAFIQELESALTDFHSLRILCSNDAQPTQLLSHIVHQKVSGKNEETEIEKGELNTQVIELCQKLFKVMKSAGEKKDQKTSAKFIQLEEQKKKTTFPTPGLVHALCDCETLMTMSEFNQFYASPVMLKLPSEQEWPIYPLVQV